MKTRTANLNIRLEPTTLARWKKAAKKLGLTLTNLVISSVDGVTR